jgi:hypothetical protein
MIFKDAALALSIKRSSPYQLFWGFSHMLRLTNWLKSLWTHYSPDFAVRHFAFRYPIEGVLNLSRLKDTGKIDRLKWIADAIPSLGRATRAIYAVKAGETTHRDPAVTKLMKYYKEFSGSGGEMAFRAMRDTDPDRMKRELEFALSEINGGKLNTTKRWARFFAESTDQIFNVWDNATRLATYAQAREQGLSIQKAAYAGANATINYRKRGALASSIGIPMPFANTAIRTGEVFGEGLYHSKNIRRTAGAVVVTGSLLGMWNYTAGGVDAHGVPYFEMIPEYQRALSLVVMNPFIRDDKGHPQTYMIPMPFNWAFPLNTGYHVAGIIMNATGAIKSGEGISHHIGGMIHSALMTFTTVVEGNNWVDNIIAEPLKPFVHIAMNKDWLGHKIHMDEDRQKGPNAYSGKKDIAGNVRTGEGWKEIAKSINFLTGGSKKKAGLFDWYPEDIREVVYQPIGAQIRFGQEIRATAKSVMKMELPKAADTPLVKVFGNPDWKKIETGRRLDRKEKNKKFWKQ